MAPPRGRPAGTAACCPTQPSPAGCMSCGRDGVDVAGALRRDTTHNKGPHGLPQPLNHSLFPSLSLPGPGASVRGLGGQPGVRARLQRADGVALGKMDSGERVGWVGARGNWLERRRQHANHRHASPGVAGPGNARALGARGGAVWRAHGGAASRSRAGRNARADRSPMPRQPSPSLTTIPPSLPHPPPPLSRSLSLSTASSASPPWPT